MSLVHFGKDLRYLVPSEVESKLDGSNVYTKKAGGWSKDAIDAGIFFNLSKVEWVELGAIAQLILLIEEALREGLRVEVALPLTKGRKSEIAYMEANPKYASMIQRRINYRKAALGFLTHLRFQEALRADHLGDMLSNLHIINDYDSSDTKPVEDEESFHLQDNQETRGEEELKEPEHLYRVCFPFCWISPHKKPDQMRNLAKFITDVTRSITDTHHGIEAVDADTIANVILYELVDNVFKHSRKKGDTPCALIAARVRPDTTPLCNHNFLAVVRPYINWLTQKQTSIVEFVVGDSGLGIKKSLKDAFDKSEPSKKNRLEYIHNKTAAIMLWAFDRWSSCYEKLNSKRGTRGLYRVDRIVKKYEGLVTLRSDNQLVGLDHGGPSHDEVIPQPDSQPKKLSYMPGTILNLWLPPFHEETLPRKVPSEIKKDLDFKILNLGIVNEEGINPKTRDKFRDLLNDENVLVLANVSGAAANHAVIYETLRQAVEIRHPGALIISGLSGGKDLIDNAVDSINDKHKEESRDKESHGTEHFEIWDPVLVLNPPGKASWGGSTKTRREVLEALMDKGGILTAEQFQQLIPDEKERTSILLGLRNDTSILTIHNDRSLELRFTLSSIAGYIQKILDKHVAESRAGVDDGIYRSPSLHLLRKWLDVEKIIERSKIGPDLTMLALSERIKEHDCWEQAGWRFDFVIYDSTSNSHNIKLLQKWLDIKKEHNVIMSGETSIPVYKGMPLVDSNARVVIYFDQLISNETTERCIKQVLRDHAKPACVTCIFDLRKTDLEYLKVWGMKIPIISLSKIDTAIDSIQSDKSPININPITKREEKYEQTSDQDNRYRINRKDFEELIEKHKALHFSHIGRPIGRHFTFYIGSFRLIEDPEIYTAFNSEISKWIAENKNASFAEFQGIEIWYPKSEPQPFAPAKRFSEKIGDLRNDIEKIRAISRDHAYGRWSFPDGQTVNLQSQNVLIIDWGALTGETVMQMIRLAVETGAKRILVCICISQLPQAEENFLYLLNSLQGPILPNKNTPSAGQLSLSFNQINAQHLAYQPIKNEVQVSVRFLSKFPIKAYPGENECPVCQRLSEFSDQSYPTELLANFAKLSNHEWLRLRKREEVVDRDSEDFLLGKSAIMMASFREDLESALNLTRMRQNVLQRIEKYYDSIVTNSSEPSEEILSLITFLSIETLWLRTPPLYFKRCRELISKISLALAINDKLKSSIRLSALIVLRVSSKSIFINNFYALFCSMINSHESLINQLLYSTFTYICRPYHQTSEMFSPLLEQLNKVKLDFVEKEPVPSTIFDTIYVLIGRTKQECSKAGIRFDSVAQSWANLRHIFNPNNYQNHDSVPTAIMVKMKPLPYINECIMDNIKQLSIDSDSPLDLNQGTELWLRNIKESWNVCCDFLDNQILINLANLIPVLQSEYGHRFIGEDIDRLIEIINDIMEKKKPLTESDFSKFVYSISEDPRKILSKEDWNKYIWNREWFESKLLRPMEENQEPSGLIKLLFSAPTHIAKVFNEEYNKFKTQLPINHRVEGLEELLSIDPLVFCLESLVREIVQVLFDNIIRYLEPKDASLIIWISTKQAGNNLSLIVRNNCTKAKDKDIRDVLDPLKVKGKKIRHGLDRVRERLSLFGGDLKPEPRPNDGESTYSVEVIFVQGE